MAVPTLYTFPAAITAGETTRLSLTFPQFPATENTAVLLLNQPGAEPVSVAGSASGSAFLFTITATQSADMPVGAWMWTARTTAIANGDVGPAQAGTFTVLPDPAGTVAKSMAAQQLDAANTALLTLVSNPEASTSFNGQSFTKENQSGLLGIIDRLKAIVAAEIAQAAGLRGDAPTRSIRPYFV